ncbi:rod shape-determining protein, partial [Patescibacteria group bacterium]|nr:rod shape-determining protein [Patescibacteria group bacterium]
EEFNILIGEQTAEKIKINIGAAVAGKEPMEMEIKGRNLFNGLPKALMINDGQIREAISHTINKIVENIKITLEKTPPELVADLYEHGIILTGGGSLLRGLDKEISTATKIPARIVEDPLTCVVRGIGVLLSDPKLLDKIILPNN